MSYQELLDDFSQSNTSSEEDIPEDIARAANHIDSRSWRLSTFFRDRHLQDQTSAAINEQYQMYRETLLGPTINETSDSDNTSKRKFCFRCFCCCF